MLSSNRIESVESINRMYGMRAALRESDILQLDARYNSHNGMIEFYDNNNFVKSIKAL
jgi:hypothetical protein